MTDLFQLTGSIMLEDKVSGQLDKINKTAKKKGSKIGKTFAKIGKGAAVLGTAATAAGAAGLAMADKFATSADRIDKSSQKMGISTDAMQEMEFAMGQVGVSADTYEKAMRRVNQRVGEAKAGNEGYTEALKDLGYTQEEINQGQIDNDEVMMRAIDTMNKMEDSQAAAAMASDLFGKKTAQEMVPAVNAGADSIGALREEAHTLGKVQSEESVAAGVKYADTMDKVKNMMSGLFMEIAGNVLPVFQKMLEWILKHLPEIKATFSTIFTAISTIIGGLITKIGELIE